MKYVDVRVYRNTVAMKIVGYLRHNPAAPVSCNAYVPVTHILQHFRIHFHQLEEVIQQPTDKQRLVLSDCKHYIRAAAGHSIPVDLKCISTKIEDPAFIDYCCHGTTVQAFEHIKEGLKTINRQYIHFVASKSTEEGLASHHHP